MSWIVNKASLLFLVLLIGNFLTGCDIIYGVSRSAELTESEINSQSLACIQSTLEGFDGIKNVIMREDSKPDYTDYIYCYEYHTFGNCFQIHKSGSPYTRSNNFFFGGTAMLREAPPRDALLAGLESERGVMKQISEKCNMPSLQTIEENCNAPYPIPGCPQ